MLNLHVVFAIDRAGLVGDDGETHHGLYDIGLLRQAPGMIVLCPVSLSEQVEMLTWAVQECTGPVAVRYPRGGNGKYEASDWENSPNTVKCHREGGDIVLITYGTLLDNVMDAAEILSQQGIQAKILRLLNVMPLPVDEVLNSIGECKTVVIVEETASGAGIRNELAAAINEKMPNCRVYGLDLGNEFVTHGSKPELLKAYGLDGQAIAEFTKGVLRCEN